MVVKHLPAMHFGCHERGSTAAVARGGVVGRRGGEGRQRVVAPEVEVCELDRAAGVDENIFELEVAVNAAVPMDVDKHSQNLLQRTHEAERAALRGAVDLCAYHIRSTNALQYSCSQQSFIH